MFEDLKPGEAVIQRDRTGALVGADEFATLLTVIKVTDTEIITSNGSRYKRDSGEAIGRPESWPYSIVPASQKAQGIEFSLGSYAITALLRRVGQIKPENVTDEMARDLARIIDESSNRQEGTTK